MNYASGITYKVTQKSVMDLVNLYKDGRLNLEPGFQRQSVWLLPARRKLIESILRNYPLPAIFLYRREEHGHLVFDVIDGKQRLESILMFTGAMKGMFEAPLSNSDASRPEKVTWAALKKRGQKHLIEGYELPVLEVNGELGDIIDVFVRINSTGKALTSQEKRHAKYYNGPFLKAAATIAKKYEKYFLQMRVFSAAQLSRMKHVELLSELMLSIGQRDVLNKKTALDRVMSSASVDGRQLGRQKRMVVSTLNRLRHMFPELSETRFSKVSDFYSLAVLIGRYEEDNFILTDRRRNKIAQDILREFSSQVDQVSLLQKKAAGTKPDQELYRDYILTVREGTDEVNHRRRRQEILDGLLGSLFARKDPHRGFSEEQRRLIWNQSSARVCAYPGCKVKLTWNDFTIDHVDPHSNGGKSELANAALMCRAHNSKKGNRRKAS